MLTFLNPCSRKIVNGYKDKKKDRDSLLFFLIPIQYLDKKLKKSLILFTCIFLLTLLATALPVRAQQNVPPEPVPRYLVRQEFLFSLVGAYVGGLFGYVLAVYLARNFQLIPCGENRPFFGPRCEWPPLVGTMIGSSLGASLLLILAAKQARIRGNGFAAFVGAGFGAWIGMIFADEYNVAPWFPLITVFIVGTPSGILAVPLYNTGATMEVKMMSLSSDRLELVNARLRW